MLIDMHHHLNCTHYPSREAYLDDMVRVASERGIDRFCLMGMGRRFNNFTNDDVEWAFAEQPSLVIGTWYFNLDEMKPGRIAEARDRGFRAVKFIAPRKNYDDESYFPAYDEAARQGMVIMFHTGIIRPTPGEEKTRTSTARMQPIFLDTIARAYPEIPVIVAHFGYPFHMQASAIMRVNDNVYCGLSGGALKNSPAIFSQPDVLPVNYEKFVFGTDALVRDFHIVQERVQTFMDDMELDDETRSAIWGDNLATLFDIE